MAKKKPVRRRRGVSIKDRLFALEQWVRAQNRWSCNDCNRKLDEVQPKARRRVR